MATGVTDRDKGFKKTLANLSAAYPAILVGVLESEGSKPHRLKEKGPHAVQAHPMTVYDIAAIHEFGAPEVGIPKRSFIRGYFDESEEKLRKDLAKLIPSIVQGTRTPEEVVNLMGVRMVGQIQARIAKRIPPPLKQATIDRKGSSVPLIDTGQLRASITYRLVPGKQ